MYVDTLNCMEYTHSYGNSVVIGCVQFDSETHFIVEPNAFATQINYVNICDFAPIFLQGLDATFDMVINDKINFQ